MKKLLYVLLVIMLVLLGCLLVMTIKSVVSPDETATAKQEVAETVEETEGTKETEDIEDIEDTDGTIKAEDESDEAADEDEDEDEEEDEKPDPFAGAWLCDPAAIYIDNYSGEYSVYITWDTSEYEQSIWEYSCTLDSATGALKGEGKKSTETFDEEGEGISDKVEYTDGSVSFTLEGNALIWADAKEDIAQGMRFEKDETNDFS